MDERITKLPKWAQEYIEGIERQRDTAIRALNEFTDNQTESPFSYEEWVSTGEKQGPSVKKRYVQTHQMNINFKGIELRIVLRPNDDGIDLSWSDEHRHLNYVSFVPRSFQGAWLVATKEPD